MSSLTTEPPAGDGAPGPAEVVGKGSVASTDGNFREQHLPQMYFSNVRQTSRLRVLVASDIHTNVEAIVLLNHWLAEKRIVVDFVLVPGDMADMDAQDQTVAEKLEGGAGTCPTSFIIWKNQMSRLLRTWKPRSGLNHDFRFTKRPCETNTSLDKHAWKSD